MRLSVAAVLLVALGALAAPSLLMAPAEGVAAKWTPAADSCGAKIKKPVMGFWSCTFVDEFSGTELDRTKWMPNTAFVTGLGTERYACYRDHPDNVNVAGGVLNLSLVKLDEPAACGVKVGPTQYMAGSVTTWHQFSQQYGRFEVRFKTEATNLPGLHEAIWLWPDERYSTINWPDSGEIDIAESFSAHPSIVGTYLHNSLDHTGMFWGVNAANCTANRGEWHTITLEWSAKRLATFLNGTPCLVNTSGDPAFNKRYIINLTQAVGGGSWNLLHEDTKYPSTMQVDYVRVWK